MRFGFTTLYSSRPHVQQMHYLSLLAGQGGHDVRFLTCDSDLSSCYTRQLRPDRPQIAECTACRVGGIRSYCTSGISGIGKLAPHEFSVSANAEIGLQSSASTLGRFESDADYQSPEFANFTEALRSAARKTYAAARVWIERERLDSVFLFNGRIDITRAVMEAAKDASIPFVSMERTWFGHGIQLLPNESCMGLKSIDSLVAAWRDRPLSRQQALTAASYIASRFLRRNHNEWRAFNVQAKNVPWPIAGGKHRILLLPGSRSETWSHADWQDGWPGRTEAFDALIEHFKLAPEDIVLRCHPLWAETIGQVSGVRAENYYKDWARKRGILCISSDDIVGTPGLMEEADAIVVNGGSAALEAGMLGKQVIALSPSPYQKAGFQTTIYSSKELAGQCLQKELPLSDQIELAARIRKETLRFCYTVAHRVPQFVPYVRCVKTTKFNYFEGADAARLTRLVKTGRLEADDSQFANDDSEENGVLDLIKAKAWTQLVGQTGKLVEVRMPVHRRHIYRGVDWVRPLMPRGD